ncbi:hypothetical protein PUN28_002656 [Cardiocondyla obscurior]|uniref:Uncharacterized protein n=1 Tax=Cardiocondyla obscurior TaxID=286306 RepID=A0AAW2GVK1_9HYME
MRTRVHRHKLSTGISNVSGSREPRRGRSCRQSFRSDRRAAEKGKKKKKKKKSSPTTCLPGSSYTLNLQITPTFLFPLDRYNTITMLMPGHEVSHRRKRKIRDTGPRPDGPLRHAKRDVGGKGRQVYMPRDSGTISPVRPNSVWVQEPWSALSEPLGRSPSPSTRFRALSPVPVPATSASSAAVCLSPLDQHSPHLAAGLTWCALFAQQTDTSVLPLALA